MNEQTTEKRYKVTKDYSGELSVHVQEGVRQPTRVKLLKADWAWRFRTFVPVEWWDGEAKTEGEAWELYITRLKEQRDDLLKQANQTLGLINEALLARLLSVQKSAP